MQNIYRIGLEIYEAENCPAHRTGQVFLYPHEAAKLCHWLYDSAHAMIRVLAYGGRLPWKYSGTPYEKVDDAEGVTTEFVRCPDPTANVILKISRTWAGYVDESGVPHPEENV